MRPAEILSFSTRWVRILIKRYNEGGPALLGYRRAHNCTELTILTPDALGILKERLKTPPADGGLWTGAKIARWLAAYHGLRLVHSQRGWDALISIGYSIQQPRPRHPQASRTTMEVIMRRRYKMSERHLVAISRRSLQACAVSHCTLRDGKTILRVGLPSWGVDHLPRGSKKLHILPWLIATVPIILLETPGEHVHAEEELRN